MNVTTTASPAPIAHVPLADRPHVSVVLVTYGTGAIVVSAIESLVASLAAEDDPSYEVIVVDNAHVAEPTRSRRELAMSTRGVRLVSPGWNTGFGGGCELGALHARGDVLVFANPDVTFEPGWLEPLLAALDDPRVSIAAPVLLDPDGGVQEAGRVVERDGNTRPLTRRPDDARRCGYGDEPVGESTNQGGASFGERSEPKKKTELRANVPYSVVPYASAACWVMRRDEHERIGGFDPAYHPAYYEDVDLALRAADLGGRCVVVGASTVVHARGGSTADATPPDVGEQLDRLRERWPSLRWR